MRFSQLATAPATDTDLATVLGRTNPHTNGVLLKLAGATVNYGTRNGANIPLEAADGVVQLLSTDISSVYVSGGGTFYVALF